MITTSPLWPNLTSIPTIMSADVRTVPLELAPEGWKIDVQRLIDMVDVRTCAILINSPNNPTGWMMEEDESTRAVGVHPSARHLDHCRRGL